MSLGRITALALTVLLAGCASPTSVRKLAERTAATTGFVRKELEALAKRNRKVAELRARNIVRMNATTREMRARHEFDLALSDQSRAQARSAQASLVAWAEKSRRILEAARVDEQAELQRFLAAQASLAPDSKRLGELAKALAKLAEKDPFVTRVRFLAGYVSEVAEQVEKERKNTEEASASAEGRAAAAAAAAEEPVKKLEQ